MTQAIKAITVEKPSPETLASLRVKTWPVWTKEISEFDWHYDEQERCYFLEGEVVVQADGQSVAIQKGDFVTFPTGLSCRWIVKKPVRKHYRFGD
jgi:uncharacterized protein